MTCVTCGTSNLSIKFNNSRLVESYITTHVTCHRKEVNERLLNEKRSMSGYLIERDPPQYSEKEASDSLFNDTFKLRELTCGN